MNNFRYIYENEQGITCFDKYMAYLQKISTEMPKTLYDFANDIRRYELNSEHTLHDSRIESLCVSKNYMSDGNVNTTIDIILVLAVKNKNLKLTYRNIMKFQLSLEPEFWLSKPVDLLSHEVSKNKSDGFRHFIQFDRGVWIDIEFVEFDLYEILELF